MTRRRRPVCLLCDRPCDEADYCAGCGEYVCEKCDHHGAVVRGDHLPGDHKGKKDSHGSKRT